MMTKPSANALTRLLPVLLLPAFVTAASSAEPTPSPYEVVWPSPSEDVNGTMPLGNGEIALNAWIDPSGDLRFYIARTDSWGDNGRLLKVGAVRVRIGDGSTERTARNFRQALTVRDGTLSARYGQGDSQVELQLWVDANRPVICVEADTPVATEAAAALELWRMERVTLPRVEVSDIYAGGHGETVVEPDTVLHGLTDRIGWYHRNTKSIGPELCARIQGVADFPRPDPLLHRTFGALIATDCPIRVDDRTLGSRAGTRHVFEIYVHTKHPATAEDWLGEATRGLDEARAIPLADRRTAHEQWWSAFWDRSWIHIRSNGSAVARAGSAGFPPANKLPIRIGGDQGGGSRFNGSFGRVGIYAAPLQEDDIQSLAATGPEEAADEHEARVFSGVPQSPAVLSDLADRTFEEGLTVEAWIKLNDQQADRGGRIVDKITVGGADGFLLDTWPGSSLRVIAGSRTLNRKDVLTSGQWQHVAAVIDPGGTVRMFLNGKHLPDVNQTATSFVADGDDASVVTRAYALQRFVAACAGRGRYPIKFNGSLFTVPAEGAPGDADYRRWGPGYWWQNTRLPYYSMCTSGDFEMLQPLFQMYARDLMPLFKYRTRLYLDHDGAYIPECIYFWGDVFTETYGWTPASEREDKLQASGWHKWEWVSGLELLWLLLDCYEHTEDVRLLNETALPVAHEILTFFDQHYRTGNDGKLIMHPSQAVETWWDCVNPMPELAGLHAAMSRLLALPEDLTTADQRAFWRQLQAKLPALPTTASPDGQTMLAPAQEFRNKRNIENPELYAVFPFRLIAIDKPNIEWGIEALEHRLDRGAMGWRQDDIFMAYLGQTDQAREFVVRRARSKHGASRFPVFWGPNYDWVPDQDHGSVLLKAVQSLLLQTDGRKIYLLPAWPADWDADFRLRAPYNTIVSGRVENGRLTDLDVQPEDRRADIIVGGGGEPQP